MMAMPSSSSDMLFWTMVGSLAIALANAGALIMFGWRQAYRQGATDQRIKHLETEMASTRDMPAAIAALNEAVTGLKAVVSVLLDQRSRRRSRADAES